MNHISKRLLMAGLIATFSTTGLRFAHADNPIIQTKFTADPAPMVHNGVVYLYTSHDEDDAPAGTGGFRMRDWMCYTSTDMVNWTDHGTVASLKNFKWADRSVSGWGGFDNGAWAPQCIERNGKFYIYCPVQGRGIGVLVADNPLGPFVDPIGKPLIGANYDSIDPTVFIDDDGQAYLYWGNPNLWFVKLNRDMISYSGEITKEVSIAKVAGQPDPFHYQEGPWAYKRNNRYYMAYASTCCPEGIGYAMSDKPTGPWKFKGYVMRPDGRSSGNHPGIIDYKGGSYVFGFNYQLNFAQTKEHHERRSVCVEKFDYNPDGTIPEIPWWSTQGAPQIGTLDPYVRTEAETICWSEGIKSEPCSEGGLNIYPTRDKSYIKIKGADFGFLGAGTFTASISCDTKAGASKGGAIELHVDNENGPLVGNLPLSYTAGQWKMETTTVNGALGIHDLFLVFKGDSIDKLFKTNYWKFEKKTTTPQLIALNSTTERYKIDSQPGRAHSVPLTVSAIYSDGTTKNVTAQAKIKMQTPGVASVSKGAITGIKPGETLVNVTFKGKSDVFPIIVKDLKTELIPQKLVPSLTSAKLMSGVSQPFTVGAEFFDGHTEDVTNRANYIVTNPKVADVKDGVITTGDEGVTTIRVEFQGDVGQPVSIPIQVSVSYRDPFAENKASEFNAQRGVETENSSEGGKNLSNIENGDWVRYNSLNFGEGANAATIRVASATNGGQIEIHLDSPDGPLVGTCQVENTGGWQKWLNKSCELREITGRHDVFFKFVGGPGFLLNVNQWRFTKRTQ